MSLLRQPLLLLARSGRVKGLVTRMPVSAAIVRSYVPGEATSDAVEASARLIGDGLSVSLDHLGEDTLDADQADATVQAYLDLLTALSARGLTRHAEVSVKLSAIGQALPHEMPLDLFWWGSDFPHSVGTFPHSRKYLEETFGEIDAELRHKLLLGNAAEHLGLDLDADITETPV